VISETTEVVFQQQTGDSTSLQQEIEWGIIQKGVGEKYYK
jgi:hypothetical protein